MKRMNVEGISSIKHDFFLQNARNEGIIEMYPKLVHMRPGSFLYYWRIQHGTS